MHDGKINSVASPMGQSLVPGQALGQLVEIVATISCYDDHVLDSNSTNRLAVDTRFNGQRVTHHQFRTLEVEQWGFVYIQPDSMARTMNHGTVVVRHGIVGDAHIKPMFPDSGNHRLMDGFPCNARFNRCLTRLLLLKIHFVI